MNENRSKVVTLPISGRMANEHSKKLEWALRDFITSMGNSYYDDELEKGFIASYFRLDNDICVEQKVHIRKADYICYTTLSCHADPNEKEKLAEYIDIVNEINLDLDYGNFEIDKKTGDIRFRTYYMPNEIVSMESLDKLLGYPKFIINKYGHVFLELKK